MKDYKKLLENLLLTVKRDNGSDLHLSVGRKPVMRVDGELLFINSREAMTKEETFGILKEIVDERELTRVMNLEEIDFSYSVRDELRLRSTAYIKDGGVSLTFRVIHAVKELDELHLPPILQTFTQREQGLFLVVGPVGQGKSTTMAAMISMINANRKEHIVTIENPIEYLFEDKQSVIDQREVGSDTKTFETGLKAIFRQDVNVIMVGEMRSPETIATVVTAAETGHLVFSTLHTNNAAQTIDRIVDSFTADQQKQVRMQLANSLLGIFSQRLIKSQRGGMVPAYELMINNKATANLIREGRSHEINNVIETSNADGMVDMNRSLVELIETGHITVDEAFRYSFNPRLLESMI